jgi:hypothetical protein
VVQKGVGGHFDNDPLALPLNRQALDPSDRRIRLALGGTESAEVVMAA